MALRIPPPLPGDALARAKQALALNTVYKTRYVSPNANANAAHTDLYATPRPMAVLQVHERYAAATLIAKATMAWTSSRARWTRWPSIATNGSCGICLRRRSMAVATRRSMGRSCGFMETRNVVTSSENFGTMHAMCPCLRVGVRAMTSAWRTRREPIYIHIYHGNAFTAGISCLSPVRSVCPSRRHTGYTMTRLLRAA